MPFSVEDKRVLCHTRNASRIHGVLSGAEWVLSSPVMPPNPNYKIKMHVTSMQIPNSFEHVGSRQNNDTLYIIRKWNSESVAEAVKRGSYLKVTITTKDGHIANVRDYFESLGTLEKAINNEIVGVSTTKTGFISTRFVPQFRIDKKGYPLQWVREIYKGDYKSRIDVKFDEDDGSEVLVNDGLVNIPNIRQASELEDLDVWCFIRHNSGVNGNLIHAHKEPFFVFYGDNGKMPLDKVHGFGFVLKGSEIGGILKSRKAFFTEHVDYNPKKSTGFYDIDPDSYYAIVACPASENTPIPEFDNRLDTFKSGESFLKAGDIRLLELPWRPPTALEIQQRLMDAGSRAFMVGSAIISALDTDNESFSEEDQGDMTTDANDRVYIFGFHTETLPKDQDQAPHKHCFRKGELTNSVWETDFPEFFRIWYFRWAVHLYDSTLVPGTALANYTTINVVTDPTKPAETEEFTGYLTRENFKNNAFTDGSSTFAPDNVYPRSQFGDTPYMAYEYKLITEYDINTTPESTISQFQGKLAEMIGYTRLVYTAGVNVPYTDIQNMLNDPTLEPLSPMPRNASTGVNSQWTGFVVAQAPCDFSGVRFIKMYTNMNVSAIDADGKDSRLIAIMPTVGSAALESNYLIGSLQGSQTFTLADTKIDRIRFDLTDDNNIPIEMYRDWWVDVTFSFEEPYSVDFYQGISKLINLGTRFTTEGYKYDDYSTITRDVGDEMDRLNSAETRNRRNNSDMGTKRKHGHGGY